MQNLQICYNLAIEQAEIGSQVEEVVGAELSVRAGSVAGVAGLPLIFHGSAGIKHWLFINRLVLSSARR